MTETEKIIVKVDAYNYKNGSGCIPYSSSCNIDKIPPMNYQVNAGVLSKVTSRMKMFNFALPWTFERAVFLNIIKAEIGRTDRCLFTRDSIAIFHFFPVEEASYGNGKRNW